MGRRKLLLPNTPQLRDKVHTLMEAYDCRDARAISQRTGGTVSHQTIHEFLRGNTDVVRLRTLTELARAFHVNLEEFIMLTTHAGATPWTLPPEFDVVPIHVRLQVERALSGLLAATGVIPPRKRASAPEEQPEGGGTRAR